MDSDSILRENLNNLVMLWGNAESMETLRRLVTIKRNQLSMMKDRNYLIGTEEDILTYEEDDYISFLMYYFNPRISGPYDGFFSKQNQIEILSAENFKYSLTDFSNIFFDLLAQKMTRVYWSNFIIESDIQELTFVYYLYKNDSEKFLATEHYTEYSNILKKVEEDLNPKILDNPYRIRITHCISISNKNWISNATKEMVKKSNAEMHTVKGNLEYQKRVIAGEIRGASLYRFQHFLFEELMYRAPYHILNPKFKALSKEKKDTFYEENALSDQNMALFRYIPFPEDIPFPDSSKRADRFTDPVPKYYGWLRGVLVKVTKTNFIGSVTISKTLNWRLVA